MIIHDADYEPYTVFTYEQSKTVVFRVVSFGRVRYRSLRIFQKKNKTKQTEYVRS